MNFDEWVSRHVGDYIGAAASADAQRIYRERTMPLDQETDVNMTTLKPVLVTACYCARYFNRDESKAERCKQAVLDVELLLKELGLADATKPAAK